MQLDMTRGSIPSLLIRFTIPLLIGNLFQLRTCVLSEMCLCFVDAGHVDRCPCPTVSCYPF